MLFPFEADSIVFVQSFHWRRRDKQVGEVGDSLLSNNILPPPPTYDHHIPPSPRRTEDLVTGLRLNGINRYSHLLTGYIGSASFLLKVADVVRELKQVNPELIYGQSSWEPCANVTYNLQGTP